MKIAITADVHLKSGAPERLENLAAILADLPKQGISTLIVAGDLLDKGYDGYKELDALLKKHPKIHLIAVPGNHDSGLAQRNFGAKNITVHSQPKLEELGGRQLFFLPYAGESMGAALEQSGLGGKLQKGKWLLVSHGDYERLRKQESGNEDGYFPLTGTDMQDYRPRLALLGHVHKGEQVAPRVIYAGSPYPLDGSEQGQRRLLVVDTASGECDSLPLSNTPIYLAREFALIPDGREEEQLGEQFAALAGELKQDLSGKNVLGKLHLSLSLVGYATSRQDLEDYLVGLCGEAGIGETAIDNQLSPADDDALNVVAREVKEILDESDLDYDQRDSLRRRVLRKALGMIYGQET